MKDNDSMDPVQQYYFRARLVRWLICAIVLVLLLVIVYLVCYGV